MTFVAVVVYVLFGVDTALSAEAVRPNIIVILADDFGCGDYSAFGTKDVKTPNVDRIFHEGMTFTNFRANSPVCSPTRAALLTGCYPDRVGVPGVIREEKPENSWGYLSSEAVLLPTLLHSAGYHSAAIGKWHLGTASPNTPHERGFRLFHGFLGDMMDDYYTHRRNGHNFMRKNDATIVPEGHATDLFSTWACDYIGARAQSGQPFFLYLAYNAPHDPLQPPMDWFRAVQEREPAMDPTRAKLVALIEHMDAGIGRVLDALAKNNIAENTIVVFTSDNGGSLPSAANNGPWRSGKTHMYEGGLRVPFAIRWPSRVKAASKCERRAVSMDLFPTALAAAGVAVPSGIDGVSFLESLSDESKLGVPRDLYFVRREGGIMYGGKTIEAFERGDWKLIQNSPFAPLELYNLRDDPYETADLAAKEKKIVQELDAALRLHIQRGGSVPWQAPSTKK